MTATAKLFTHGGSQAVRLPKAFRFEGTEVSVRKEGDAVILEPLASRRETWEELFTRMDSIGAGRDFPEHIPRDPWPEPVEFEDKVDGA
jgi:antitoxin VapB